MVTDAFDHINQNDDEHLSGEEAMDFVHSIEKHFEIDFEKHLDDEDKEAIEAGLKAHSGEKGMDKKQMFEFMNAAVDYVNHRTGNCEHEKPDDAKWAHAIKEAAEDEMHAEETDHADHAEHSGSAPKHHEHSGTESHEHHENSGSESLDHEEREVHHFCEDVCPKAHCNVIEDATKEEC